MPADYSTFPANTTRGRGQTQAAGHIWIDISGQIMKTSLFSLTGIVVSKGNHPKMALRFRLVKYYFIYPDILTYIYMHIYIYILT